MSFREVDKDASVTLSQGATKDSNLYWDVKEYQETGSYTMRVETDDDFEEFPVDVIPSSAIAHFKHSSGSGTTLTDSIGANDGTISGATWQSGTYIDDYALDYDFTDDYVEWSTYYSEVGTNKAYSVAFTLETGSDVSTEQFVWQHSPANDDRSTVSIESGKVRASHYNGSNYVAAGSGSVSTNTKYRVFYVHSDSTTGTLYLNATEQTGTSSSNAGAGYFTLGARDDGANPFAGRTDDLLIMDVAESQSTVQDDYDRQPWS